MDGAHGIGGWGMAGLSDVVSHPFHDGTVKWMGHGIGGWVAGLSDAVSHPFYDGTVKWMGHMASVGGGWRD